MSTLWFTEYERVLAHCNNNRFDTESERLNDEKLKLTWTLHTSTTPVALPVARYFPSPENERQVILDGFVLPSSLWTTACLLTSRIRAVWSSEQLVNFKKSVENVEICKNRWLCDSDTYLARYRLAFGYWDPGPVGLHSTAFTDCLWFLYSCKKPGTNEVQICKN